MAQPTLTRTLGDREISVIDTYVHKTPADVLFERNLIFGSLWRAAREPGVPGERPPAISLPSGRMLRKTGRELWLPIASQRATTVQAFQHLDMLPTALDPALSVQRSSYAYYTGFAALSWQEDREASGPEGLIDLMQARIDSVFRTFSETVETDLWSTGSGTDKKILGLQHLISTTPTSGTVWNLDRSTETFHRNNVTTVTDTFANVGLDNLRSMVTTCSGTSGSDRPSVMITTPTLFNAYRKEAEDLHQITDTRLADLGFQNAVYEGIPIVYSALCPSGKIYVLNLGYFVLLMPPGTDFESFSFPTPNNQLIARQWRVVWAGQWGCERYDRQGVITGFTDS